MVGEARVEDIIELLFHLVLDQKYFGISKLKTLPNLE